MILTPCPLARYVVVSTSNDMGPADVSFWDSYESIISLMTGFANNTWHNSQGFSVWHRRTATSRWKLITNTSH